MDKQLELLMVDDNPHDAFMVERILKKEGVIESLFWMKDGLEAQQYLFNSNQLLPKCLLLDLKMPKMTGIELLVQIRSNERTRHLPVVIYTSSSRQKDIDEAYEAGVNSYVVKGEKYEQTKEKIYNLSKFWLQTNTIKQL